MDDIKYDDYNKNLEKLHNEINELVEREKEYEELKHYFKLCKKECIGFDLKFFKKMGGVKRGLNAKRNQLNIIYTIILLERKKGLKITAYFAKKLIKKFFNVSIKNAELFKYFSCKNNIKICKNVNINTYCKIDEISNLYEYATLKIKDDIFLLKNKKESNNKEEVKKVNIKNIQKISI